MIFRVRMAKNGWLPTDVVREKAKRESAFKELVLLFLAATRDKCA